MNFPPRGYDDETILPQKRLKLLLGELETEFTKIQNVFYQYLPGQFAMSTHLEKEFSALRVSADELGIEHAFLVEKLISDYENFRANPDQEKLDILFGDVKSLQLLLV